jgi:hypothetical protein
MVKFLTVQNKSKLKSMAYLRFSPASAKRGSVRFLAWRIEDKEAKRVLNFGKQDSSALNTANQHQAERKAQKKTHLTQSKK